MAPLFTQKIISRKALAGGLALILLLAAGYLFHQLDLSGRLRDFLESGISPAVFVALMAILPILGAPIAVFLVLVGMRFGIAAGILLSAVLMFLHMAVTYYLVNSLLRSWISRLLQRCKVSTPTLLHHYTTWQAVIFMLVPGVPYAVKNNLLALAGYRFAPYMAINWLTQYLHGIPLIVLGGAVVNLDLAILGVACLLLLLGYLLQRFIRTKIREKREKNGDIRRQ